MHFRIMVFVVAMCGLASVGHSSEKRTPESTSEYLGSLAYLCQLKADIARETDSPTDFRTFLDREVKKARECIEYAQTNGKVSFQETLADYPESKAALSKVYSAWLSYLGSLEYFFEVESQLLMKERFTSAQSELKAELDSKPAAP